jgi:hypothetical protein
MARTISEAMALIREAVIENVYAAGRRELSLLLLAKKIGTGYLLSGSEDTITFVMG